MTLLDIKYDVNVYTPDLVWITENTGKWNLFSSYMRNKLIPMILKAIANDNTILIEEEKRLVLF